MVAHAYPAALLLGFLGGAAALGAIIGWLCGGWRAEATIARRSDELQATRHALRTTQAQLEAAHEEAFETDEAELAAKIGEELSRVLRVARATAEDIESRAQARAQETMREAEAYARRLRREAEKELRRRRERAEPSTQAVRPDPDPPDGEHRQRDTG